jgi:DNA replication licensing factor MCM6
LDTQEDLSRERDLCTKVIKRMVREGMLLRITSSLEDEASTQQDGEGDKVLYVLHPNIAFEEL